MCAHAHSCGTLLRPEFGTEMKIISLVKMYRKAPAGWMANQPVRVCRIDDYYQVMYLHMYSIIHARLTIRKLQGHHQKTLA